MSFRFRRREPSLVFGLTMLLVGLGVGAATALLFAPRTGQQMRRSVRRKLEDAAETVNEIKEQAGEALERSAAFAKGAAEVAKEKVAPLVRAVGSST